MEFMKNFHRLHKGKCWSSMFFSVAFFVLANVGPSHAFMNVKSYKIKGYNDIIQINFTRALIVQKNCEFTTFDIDNMHNSAEFILAEMKSRPCIFETYLKNPSIPPLLESQGPTKFNFQHKLIDARDVAYDFINSRLYKITKKNKVGSNKLVIVDMISGHTAIAITDLAMPKNIQVDPSAGLLFILQQSSILRANMDGTSRINFIEKIGISSIAIDRKSKRIYWATEKKIESSSYYDAHQERREVALIARPVRDLAVLGDDLFWLSAPHGFTKPTPTISHCTMGAFTICDESSSTTIPFDNPQTIKTYDSNEIKKMMSEKTNPCENQSPKCEHFCFVKNESYTCACDVGYKLQRDGHNCQLANDKFLLYVKDKQAQGIILGLETSDMFNFVDAINPITLESQAKLLSFDYDYQSNYIYFTDNTPGDNKLYVKKLDGTKKQMTMFSYKGTQVLSTATDWISKNVYQLVLHKNNPRHHCALMVHRYSELDDEENSLVYTNRLIKLPDMWEAGSIVVHPLRGLLFISVKSNNKEEGRIYKANLDGSNFTSYIPVNASLNELAIDFEYDRLYWIHANKTYLMSYDFDNFFGMKGMDISIVKNPMSVSSNGNYVYVGNLTSIWRFNKWFSGVPVKVVEPADPDQPKTIIGTKIYGQSAQPISSGHPCTIDNGGCEKFCYPVPSGKTNLLLDESKLRRQCGCEKEDLLSLDRVTCEPQIPK